MAYTVLARRYRSETFDDLVGQEAVAQTLKKAINSDRVAHAYLFTGTRGVGKTSMARILAKALNCLAFDQPTATPCCQCDSCQAISVGSDIDVIEIDGASNTGVDNVRELRQNAIYKPARSRFKIYIIDEVHMLSSGAFNALLKTLEEPPAHVKFIFATTEAGKILPTILSRCQRFDFRNIQPGAIAGHLRAVLQGEGVTAEDALVRRVARLANGSMRDGLSLLDQLLSMGGGQLTAAMLDELLGTPGGEEVLALVDAISRGQLAGALQELDRVVSQGLAPEQIADALQSHFRDLMMLRNCGADTELVDLTEPSQRQRAVDQSKLFDDAALVYAITVMEELKRALKSSGSARPLLEATLVRLTVSERFSDTKQLIEMLRALPAGSATPANPSAAIPSSSSVNYSRPQPISVPAAAAPANPPLTPSFPAPPVPPAVAAQDMFAPPSWKNRQAAAAAAAVEPPLQEAPADDSPFGKVNLALFGQHWQELVERMGVYKEFLRKARPAQWDGVILTLDFAPEDIQLRQGLVLMGGYAEKIEHALSGILKAPVKVRVDLASGPATAGAGTTESRIAPGSKPSQQENQAAASDKRVRQVVEILNGKIASIERINE